MGRGRQQWQGGVILMRGGRDQSTQRLMPPPCYNDHACICLYLYMVNQCFLYGCQWDSRREWDKPLRVSVSGWEEVGDPHQAVFTGW